METSPDLDELKSVVKTALLEVFEEHQDLLRNAVSEALEEWL